MAGNWTHASPFGQGATKTSQAFTEKAADDRGAMYNQQFQPYYNFVAGQQQQHQQNQGALGQLGTQGATSLGNNFVQGATALGNTAMQGASGMGNNAMNLYGQLAGMQQQQQRFNALAPALGGLLNQFGFGGVPGIGQVGDPMAGYGNALSQAYGNFGAAQNAAYGNLASANNSALGALGTAQNYGYAQNDRAADAFSNRFDNAFNRQAAMMPAQYDDAETQGGGFFGAGPGGGQQSSPDADAGVEYEMQRLRSEMTGSAPPKEPMQVNAQQRLLARQLLGQEMRTESRAMKYATPVAPKYRRSGSTRWNGRSSESEYEPVRPVAYGYDPRGYAPPGSNFWAAGGGWAGR